MFKLRRYLSSFIWQFCTAILNTKSGFIGTVLEDAGLSRPPSQDLNLEETQKITGDTIQYTISQEVIDKADGDAIFVIVTS
ncbi:MAG: hypothetical protein AAFY16_09565 [Cyanobacteria bacterium J06642_3]